MDPSRATPDNAVLVAYDPSLDIRSFFPQTARTGRESLVLVNCFRMPIQTVCISEKELVPVFIKTYLMKGRLEVGIKGSIHNNTREWLLRIGKSTLSNLYIATPNLINPICEQYVFNLALSWRPIAIPILYPAFKIGIFSNRVINKWDSMIRSIVDQKIKNLSSVDCVANFNKFENIEVWNSIVKNSDTKFDDDFSIYVQIVARTEGNNRAAVNAFTSAFRDESKLRMLLSKTVIRRLSTMRTEGTNQFGWFEDAAEWLRKKEPSPIHACLLLLAYCNFSDDVQDTCLSKLKDCFRAPEYEDLRLLLGHLREPRDRDEVEKREELIDKIIDQHQFQKVHQPAAFYGSEWDRNSSQILILTSAQLQVANSEWFSDWSLKLLRTNVWQNKTSLITLILYLLRMDSEERVLIDECLQADLVTRDISLGDCDIFFRLSKAWSNPDNGRSQTNPGTDAMSQDQRDPASSTESLSITRHDTKSSTTISSHRHDHPISSQPNRLWNLPIELRKIIMDHVERGYRQPALFGINGNHDMILLWYRGPDGPPRPFMTPFGIRNFVQIQIDMISDQTCENPEPIQTAWCSPDSILFFIRQRTCRMEPFTIHVERQVPLELDVIPKFFNFARTNNTTVYSSSPEGLRKTLRHAIQELASSGHESTHYFIDRARDHKMFDQPKERSWAINTVKGMIMKKLQNLCSYEARNPRNKLLSWCLLLQQFGIPSDFWQEAFQVCDNFFRHFHSRNQDAISIRDTRLFQHLTGIYQIYSLSGKDEELNKLNMRLFALWQNSVDPRRPVEPTLIRYFTSYKMPSPSDKWLKNINKTNELLPFTSVLAAVTVLATTKHYIKYDLKFLKGRDDCFISILAYARRMSSTWIWNNPILSASLSDSPHAMLDLRDEWRAYGSQILEEAVNIYTKRHIDYNYVDRLINVGLWQDRIFQVCLTMMTGSQTREQWRYVEQKILKGLQDEDLGAEWLETLRFWKTYFRYWSPGVQRFVDLGNEYNTFRRKK